MESLIQKNQMPCTGELVCPTITCLSARIKKKKKSFQFVTFQGWVFYFQQPISTRQGEKLCVTNQSQTLLSDTKCPWSHQKKKDRPTCPPRSTGNRTDGAYIVLTALTARKIRIQMNPKCQSCGIATFIMDQCKPHTKSGQCLGKIDRFQHQPRSVPALPVSEQRHGLQGASRSHTCCAYGRTIKEQLQECKLVNKFLSLSSRS